MDYEKAYKNIRKYVERELNRLSAELEMIEGELKEQGLPSSYLAKTHARINAQLNVVIDIISVMDDEGI